MHEPITLTKRPTEARAIQWTGDNWEAVKGFAGENVALQMLLDGPTDVLDGPAGELQLLAGVGGAQGWVPVPLGHWIFGAPGDFWPVADSYVVEHYARPGELVTVGGEVKQTVIVKPGETLVITIDHHEPEHVAAMCDVIQPVAERGGWTWLLVEGGEVVVARPATEPVETGYLA